MDLQEEYYLRNKIEQPIIRFCPGYLFFRSVATNVDMKWRIFGLSHVNKDGDPGRFDLRIYYPQHNGYKNKSLLSCQDYNEKSDRCWWENYEESLKSYLSRFVKMFRCEPILKKEELLTACWEILLYTHDSCVAELPFDQQEILHQTLENANLINETAKMFSTRAGQQMKLLHQGWTSLLSYTGDRNYGAWLANLVAKGG